MHAYLAFYIEYISQHLKDAFVTQTSRRWDPHWNCNINWFNCRWVTIQPYPMNKEASISADWTGGLAYRDATVMEALLKARGPRQSPALPIASTGPGAEDNITPILCISEQCGDESSPVFSLMLCSKVLSEECRTRWVSEKKRWERMNEAEQFSVKAHQNTIYLEACICLREAIQTLFPL